MRVCQQGDIVGCVGTDLSLMLVVAALHLP